MPNRPQTFRFGKLKPAKPNRESSAKRGYDRAWRTLQAAFLRAHPLCRLCEAAGRLAEATLVDHVEPIQDRYDQRRLDENNLQSLCDSCHSIKTMQDRREGKTR